MLTVAITIPIITYFIHFGESKYILIIFFGYFCYQVWGEDGRPKEELALFWTYVQPFVFATVGASVQFKKIKIDSFGLSIAVILLGLLMRWIGTVLAASEPKFEFKEKAFLGFAWIPKATVQAAIGGTFLIKAQELSLTKVKAETKAQWIAWGEILLSMAVIAVIITAPLGAILTNTLGVKWLSHDEDYDPVTHYADEGTKMGASMRRPVDGVKDPAAINGKVSSGTGPDIEMN